MNTGDRYGDKIANRYRFLGELLGAMRGAVGNEYPIFIKLSGNDFFPGGLTPDESLDIDRRLAADGIGCIEVSGGRSPFGKGGFQRGVTFGGRSVIFSSFFHNFPL